MKSTQGTILLLIVTIVALVLLTRSSFTEALTPMPDGIKLPNAQMQLLEKSVINLVVGAYTKEIGKLPEKPKPVCATVFKNARATLSAALATRLVSFEAAHRKGILAAADDLAKAVESFITRAHCTGGGAAVADVKRLQADMKQLGDSFATGVTV